VDIGAVSKVTNLGISRGNAYRWGFGIMIGPKVNTKNEQYAKENTPSTAGQFTQKSLLRGHDQRISREDVSRPPQKRLSDETDKKKGSQSEEKQLLSDFIFRSLTNE
jgi:hypothetical protein